MCELVSPVSSRCAGHGVGRPLGGQRVWEEAAALRGFAAALAAVPLDSGRPTSTPLIHERVSIRVKTHRLTPPPPSSTSVRMHTSLLLHTAVRGRRPDWVFCRAFGGAQLVAAPAFAPFSSPNVPKSMVRTKEGAMELPLNLVVPTVGCRLAHKGDGTRRCLFPISITTLTAWPGGRDEFSLRLG